MIVKLGAALSVQVQYIQLRGGTYQFRIRIPKHLLQHYGKPDIRKSLGTSNLKTASRLAEQEARKYLAEFKPLTEGKPITPQDVATAGRMLAEQYAPNFEALLDHVINPAREKYAAGDENDYQGALSFDYLKPEQLQAWQIIAKPNAFRLSDALTMYFKNHQRGSDEAFVTRATRDWNSLTATTGDVLFEELSRTHARNFVDRLTAKSNKTGTIRRTLNTIGAIVRSTITELELSKTDPFKSIKIQGEGRDTEKATTASTDQLHEIATTFLPETTSPPVPI